MSELSPRAREILDAARRAPCAPDEATVKRMERTVLLAGGTTALTLGGLKAASSGLAGKGAMAAVAVAIVGTTAAVTVTVAHTEFVQSLRRAPQVRTSKPAPAPVVNAPPVVLPAPPAVAVSEPTLEVPPAVIATPREEDRVVRAVRPRTPAIAPVLEKEPERAAPPPSALAAELSILRTAKTELDAGRWAGALEALSRHDTEFPSPALRDEAEVLAWCGQGRTGEAMQRAFELRTRAPNSPAIARLAGSCVDL